MNMNELLLFYNVMAIIGFIVVTYYGLRLLFEIWYVLCYALGHTILIMLNVNYHKAKKIPFKFLKAILQTFAEGLLDANYSTIEVKYGNWAWKPLFRFRKTHITSIA